MGGNSGKPKHKAENSTTIGQKCYRFEKSGHFAKDMFSPARDNKPVTMGFYNSVSKMHRKLKETHIIVFAELGLKTTFSDENVLNGKHISMTIKLIFISHSNVFQSSFSNSLFKK